MPSPFPGMDPYMEDPASWSTVHSRIIAHISDTLNSVIPSRYIASISERVYVENREEEFSPDVMVESSVARAPQIAATLESKSAARSSWRVRARPVEIRETFIEILSVKHIRRVVTVIEVLSPTNKTSRGAGQKQYLKKQKSLLNSRTNLVEIDLLRRGKHTIAAPLDVLSRRGTWDYLTCVHRHEDRWEYEVWPVMLRERLPVISLPLGKKDSEVEIDLQIAVDKTYDSQAFARRINYRTEPNPPLRPDDAAWADALLREKGHRK